MSDDLKSQQEPVSTSIKDRDFPSLYQSADQASLAAQRCYLLFQGCHLFLLILGSLVTVLIPIVSFTWLPSILAIILMVTVTLTWISRSRRDDEVWFNCRAIAESTKTTAWRFMMKAAPFEDNSAAKGQFISKLKEIRKARSSSLAALAKDLDVDAQSISDFMNDMRTKSLSDRKTFYIKSRLLDQKAWYSKKADYNLRNKSYWSWITIVLQILATSLAIVQAVSSSLSVNVVPILITCVAAAVAWSQMKRHGELAQTYSLATQELGDQEALDWPTMKEDDFLSLVEQVEETISREHTMWYARREVQST